MTEKGFPWDSVEGDARSISAANIAAAYKTIINNGVVDYENDFLIEIIDSVSKIVNIKSGLAWIEGHLFPFNGVETLTLPEGEVTTGTAYPGLIVLKCRPETEYMDFVFDVKYSTDGTEPGTDENEISLYRFRYTGKTLKATDFKRVVTAAVPNNMVLNVLRMFPNSPERLEFGQIITDGTGIYTPGMFLYSTIYDDPYAKIMMKSHEQYGYCTVYGFLNGLLISDSSLSMRISMVPNHFHVRMPDGTYPFENWQGEDPFTAMRWQSADGSKNTQVLCKQDKLMCYINGTGTQLAAWSSDKSLKKNIKNTDVTALDLLMKIQHKQFDWKTTGQHQSIGYIANQLQKISEDFVIEVPQEDGQVLLQVDEKTIIPLLSKAIQEQQQTINNMQERLEKLEKKVTNGD